MTHATVALPERGTGWIWTVRSLHLVRLGQIVAVTRTGVLQHRLTGLPPEVIGALLALRENGLVTLGSRDGDGWLPAELTALGWELLATSAR